MDRRTRPRKPNGQIEDIMAKTQIKTGGPCRGKRRVRKMGMGSGARRAKARANDKKTRG